MTLVDKKIAFILYNYPLGVSTMIINAIELLGTNNKVDVIVSADQNKTSECDDWLKKLLVPLLPSKTVKLRIRLFQKAVALLRLLSPFLPIVRYWLDNLHHLSFTLSLRERIRTSRYDILMPVECFSLIATDWANVVSAQMVYFDMELLDWNEDNSLYGKNKLLIKQLQHRALQRVSHVMITSPNRAKLFAEINDFPEDRISVLPVVPRKRAAEKSRYFREKFDIPTDKIVVIYSGNFQPWAQCIEIIQSMNSWPGNAVLVMHTWNSAVLETDYFRSMTAAAEGYPVFFSADYLRYSELASALTSADIGLLFYEDIDQNFNEIMFSSNKMGEYMAAGLPVICSPYPSLREFVTREEIGRAVTTDEAGAAIEDIIERLDAYKKNVVRCCEEYFVFDRYFEDAIKRYDRSLLSTEEPREGDALHHA